MTRPLTLLLLLSGLAISPAVHAQADDWQVTRSPFDPRLVARYLDLLHQHPDDRFAWSRLTALYRRHRSLQALDQELLGRTRQRPDAVWLYLAARVARERGQTDEAIRRYRDALRIAPPAGSEAPRILVGLAEMLDRASQPEEARPLYEQALPRLPREPRLAVLRRLAELALDAKELAAARRRLEELVALAPADVEARRQLAETLARQRDTAAALTEWRDLAARTGARPERRAEAFRRVAELEERRGALDAARAACKSGLAVLPPGHPVRRALRDQLVALYRRADDLRTLIAELERDPGRREAADWELLARLYDEVGDAGRALATYRRALAAGGRQAEVRRRVAELLERSGRDEEALREYERLAAAAPGEPRLQIELAERMAKLPGGAPRAHALLARLGARYARDPGVHAALAELYGRWGDEAALERERALLVRIEPDDARHLIDLGELYWQRGDTQRAEETWNRLLGLGPSRVEAWVRLAEVLLDHDRIGEAVELYEKATRLAPRDLGLRRGLAVAYERIRRVEEAADLWLSIFFAARAPADQALRQEARQHWARLVYQESREGPRQLEERLGEARRYFEEERKDDWAWLLVDGLLRLERPDEAMAVLRELARRTHDDATRGEALIALGQLHRQRHELAQAIAAFDEAARSVPSRGRELYPQIAELSLELHRDDQALDYARRAVALAPVDAQAQLRLAELLERRGDEAGALDAYRRARELDPRQFRAHLALARLHLRRDEVREAALLYREIALTATDEQLILEAARHALVLEEYLGTLPELARALAPLADARSPKPAHRRLLLDLYGALVTPLAARAPGQVPGAPAAGDAAAERELAQLGERGLKPLSEVLLHGEPAEQRAAVRLLGELRNPNAAPLLLRLAGRRAPSPTPAPGSGSAAGGGPGASTSIGPADIDLRVAAVLAVARLGSAGADEGEGEAIAELAALASDPEVELRVAVLYALTQRPRGPGPAESRLRTTLGQALMDPAPTAAAMACLGLGRRGDSEARWRDAMRMLVADAMRPPLPRAACALALGALRDTAAVAGLVDALEGAVSQGAGPLAPRDTETRSLSRPGQGRPGPGAAGSGDVAEGEDRRYRDPAPDDDLLAAAAAWSLGAMNEPGDIDSALLRAVFRGGGELRRTAAAALARRWAPAGRRPPAPLFVPDVHEDALDVRGAVLRTLQTLPPPVVALGDAAAVARALTETLSGPPPLAGRALADLSLPAWDRALITLGPLTPPSPMPSPSAGADAAVEPVLREVAAQVEPAVTRLLRVEDLRLRRRAVTVLGRIATPSALSRLSDALSDAEPGIRLAALDALSLALGDAAITARLRPSGEGGPARHLGEQLLRRLASDSWRERAAAATALGAWLPLTSPVAHDDLHALARLLDDPHGYVRQATALALGRLGPDAVAPLAAHAGERVGAVRVSLAEALGRTRDPRAQTALAALRRDPDPRVRAAAEQAASRLPSGP
ncbi:MAG TPA: HEAT repeat domain-containing protein [Polyangia bacterium]|nr:HEAT repeat domain-containing protein [Polyangia bacterium]